MNINFAILFLLWMGQWCFGQAEKPIRGKILVSDAMTEGIRIINLVNEKEAVTDKNGAFVILAKPDDLLVFSAIHLDYMRKIIEQQDYDSGSVTIAMTSKINELDEVEIIDYGIDAVSLGILSKPAKRYTPAQRRLRTATAAYPVLYAGTMAGGAVGLDPVINWISGRTARLKKELNAEQKEMLLSKLTDYFQEDFYTETLKIAAENIGSFQYYCIYDTALETALNSKNKIHVTFNMMRLATEFNTLQKHEK